MEINKIYNEDCIVFMRKLSDNFVDFTLTDIPYDEVNRSSNGIRNFNKGAADILTFNLLEFCEEVYRITKNSICIFCGKGQFSFIYDYFAQKHGTTRCIVWQKTNPSPVNGQYIYLSGVELAVWFKKRGAKTFNAFCKNTVFHYPNGRSKYHPTEKNKNLFLELIKDNTNEYDVVFDPCVGGGTAAICAKELNRQYLGCELNNEYYKIAVERINT